MCGPGVQELVRFYETNSLALAPNLPPQSPLRRGLLLHSLGREEEVGVAHNPHLHNANHASHEHSKALQVVHTAHGSLIVETATRYVLHRRRNMMLALPGVILHTTMVVIMARMRLMTLKC